MNSVNIGSCYMWPLLHSIMIRGSALVSLLSLNSCGLQKVDVSSRVDSSITSPASKENPQTPYIDPAASDLWPAAKDILDRKCIPCHSAKGPATFAVFDFKTEEEFKLSRFIVPGKSIDSLLIKKSIGFDQSSNMPIGAAWSATEYDALKSWVDGMSTGSRPIGPATSYLVFPGYECRDPGLASAVESRTLKRKTKQELSYKLKDLLSYRLSDQSIANQISDLLDPSFSRMPAERHEKMDVFDQSTNLDFLENYFQAVFIFATEVTKTPALIQDFTDSTCITSGAPTQACIDGVITDLSYSIMERVPLAADIAGLKAAYNADASGRVRGLIATMLMSVPSTHHLYYRGTAVSPNQYLLTDLELAYKMSYLLWGSIPDPTLLTLAKQNQLTQGSNFETQLARMTNHAYFDRGLNNFFTNWYKLDHLQALNKIAPRTLTKLALFGVTDAEKLLQDIKVDGLLFSNWVVKQDLSYDELLLNRRSFAPTGDLAAKIYNVAAWDKANPTEINHSASRAGILTRA
ncbi:MAG: DUF1592 domain-containing protein, partial [Proteobacteria bacterium]|nr:DUF1592 domain-containing protein [Pseudomonadota bacterium]